MVLAKKVFKKYKKFYKDHQGQNIDPKVTENNNL